jgi:undecaprenyl diphosphate synthase
MDNLKSLPSEKIPKHIAIVMDGNRRWARARSLREIEGHRKAAENIKPLVERCARLGVKHLTFWAFSTENWKRNKAFINDIMILFREYLGKKDLFEELKQKGGEVRVLGDLGRFPKDIRESVSFYLAQAKPQEKKININLALNYGGRDEILRAVRKVIDQSVKKEELTEELFSQFLDTAGQPDPDLVIRTGGEIRLSGYLLWQAAYSEFYFTDTLMPDFGPSELDKAIVEYSRRERRFGGDSKR